MSSGDVQSLTPCIVVVDSRNVRGQARKVFGHGRETHVSGIRAGLAHYGLNAVEVIVGVATRTATNHPSDRLRASLNKNIRFKERLENAGAVVLEGHLVQRANNFEEKQVDVLCALAIADAADRINAGTSIAKCVVVLSEDMDLMPAIEFAVRRGVATYAAAYDTVHQRPSQREWLILHEEALIAICDPPGRTHGSALRDQLAAIATSSTPRATQWKVVAPRMNDGRALLSNNLGANGLWVPDRKLHRGDKVSLFVTDVEMDPHSSRFPYLVLASQPGVAPSRNLEIADVLYWTEPTLVKVRIRGSGEEATLKASPGVLLPTQEVAVLKVLRDGNTARYLVGALSPRVLPKNWSNSAGTGLVEIVAPPGPSGAWLNAVLVDTADEVLVKASLLDHAQVGNKLAVAVVGESQSGTPHAMPLSCCLP